MASPAQGKYINRSNLINRMTAETYLACFDDENTGDVANVNDDAVQACIDQAEGEVDSYLITERALPLASTTNPSTDRILVMSALDFAESLSWYRHPEYVRTYGENPKAEGLWERASKRMERVKEGRQQLPDQDTQNGAPNNTKGIVYDTGPRTAITSSDGTENGDGF